MMLIPLKNIPENALKCVKIQLLEKILDKVSKKLSNTLKRNLFGLGQNHELAAIKPEADPNPLTEPKWLV